MSNRVRKIVLAITKYRDMDMIGIAKAASVSRQTASVEVRKMLAEGLVHISRREGYQQRAYYMAGNGDNAPRKKSARQHIVDMLSAGEHSALDMAEIIGVSRQSTQTLISQLKAEGVKIRISGWTERTKGPRVAIYTIGEGEDAERPEALTNAEKVSRYRSSEKGQATCRKCARRWRRSAAGKEYNRKHRQAKSAINRFNKHGIAGIDPLLAKIMGVR